MEEDFFETGMKWIHNQRKTQ